ncbi:GntR family transcriptional regulator [Paenibacillus eucommiae]|uniref:GntR family transcriptional regulator of gluconate operon n=1 Tax=Paenibacillus eucommiae TaxID=1355755 RepID=A0ABS4J791_9BACL|nr:GntR family transcriptional regulator [Paenibacillus eucommiae]MBP1995721.1 GntR family transcriptional regulator of gluconate operon [Paenibacillus eucommiae]
MDKIQNNNLSEIVVKKLRKMILLGQLGPSLHLKEPDLAEQFGVSRGPIRDALQILIREGFVQRMANRRVVVRGFTSEDISDLYDMRLLLESHAIAIWQQRGCQTHMLESLQDAIWPMENNFNFISSEEFSALDMAYHEALVSLSENKSLLHSWLGLKDILSSFLEVTNQGKDRSSSIVDVHRKMAQALQEKKIDVFIQLLEEHFKEAKTIMLEQVNRIRQAVSK